MPDLPDDAQMGVPSPWIGGPLVRKVETHGCIKIWFDACPQSQTLEAYSGLYKCTVWICLACKKWSCPYCAEKKIYHLSRRCETAKPNRLLTLTVDPALWNHPRHAFDGTRRKVPELIRTLRKDWGEVEYMRVTELTVRGWPHYHMLVRSPYIPQSKIKDAWERLTGATVVDIRKINNHYQTFRYLVKYLSKMHNLQWTERHVSYSRHFFEKEKEYPKTGLELTELNIRETHIATLFYHQFRKSSVCMISPGVYTLDASSVLIDQLTAPETDPVQNKDEPQCLTTSPSSPTSPAASQTSMSFCNESMTPEEHFQDSHTPSGSLKKRPRTQQKS